jgi:SAM-dependent methyltransferase
LERAATGGADFFQYIVNMARHRQGARILSLASGPGGVELDLARKLGAETMIECIEINEELIALGTERAREERLNVRFYCQDINALRLEPRRYDLIMAHAALHHFVALEHIFTQVHAALKPDGEFVVNDVTSRNGYELWPETKAMVGQLWALLPERLRVNRSLYPAPQVDPEYPDRNYLGDGFECVRSQDILPLLQERFQVVHCVPYFAFARRFFDRMFGPNYDLSKPFDRAAVEFIWQLDCGLIRAGALRPETAFLVLRRTDGREQPLGE